MWIRHQVCWREWLVRDWRRRSGDTGRCCCSWLSSVGVGSLMAIPSWMNLCGLVMPRTSTIDSGRDVNRYKNNICNGHEFSLTTRGHAGTFLCHADSRDLTGRVILQFFTHSAKRAIAHDAEPRRSCCDMSRASARGSNLRLRKIPIACWIRQIKMMGDLPLKLPCMYKAPILGSLLGPRR